jgi:PD-(D/E)XK nuclease superfamily
MDQASKDILEALVIDNADLILLESKLSGFNIFEAVGMTRQEIRHSYFLSFLFNPSESHYFGNLFLKRFLIAALPSFENPPFSAIEIDVADLEDAEIKREYKNIDILIASPGEKIVIAIENKVDSLEHSDQLNRYRKIVEADFPGYRKLFIYLTKEGDLSSDRETWHSLNYEIIARCIDDICLRHGAKLNADVQSLMAHYSNLIKRHIMTDSEIAQLCRKIYKQHRQALDLIYEHRPDFQLEISDYLQQLIEQHEKAGKIEKDASTKKHPRFAVKEWDKFAFQRTCEKWTSSKRTLLFEFWNDSQYLGLNLTIAPADDEVKQLIYEAVRSLNLPELHTKKLKVTGWDYIFRMHILKSSDYEEGDLERIKEKINLHFDSYMKNQVMQICRVIAELDSPLVDSI